MKILHIINHTGRFNGNVHAAVDLACAQADAGHKVAVCHGGGDFDATFATHGVETFVLRYKRRPIEMLQACARISTFLEGWRPDVIHAHMLTSLLVAFPAAKLRRIPIVATVHNAFERSAFAMGIAQKVIAVSTPVGESLCRSGIARSKIRVVLNGTIGSARRSSDADPPHLQHPAILFVGGLHPRKGVSDLLSAFDLFCRSGGRGTLYLVGEGPCADDYHAQAAAMACAGRVVFAGSHRDPFVFMQAADVLVLPSLADPAPLVISEARDAGCAIIATNVDGIPEMLDDGNAGLLVAAKAPSEIAQALSRLLSNLSELSTWKRKSKFGSERFLVQRVSDQSLAVYAECRRETPSFIAQIHDFCRLMLTAASKTRHLNAK